MDMKRACCLLALILALPVLAQEELLRFHSRRTGRRPPWAIQNLGMRV